MSKLQVLLLAGLTLSLAACSGQAPKPTVAPTAAVPPTAVKAAPTVVSALPSSGPAKLDPAGACKVSASPKPAANFPASLPADQVKGSDKAAAVLYEYSDFQ